MDMETRTKSDPLESGFPFQYENANKLLYEFILNRCNWPIEVEMSQGLIFSKPQKTFPSR